MVGFCLRGEVICFRLELLVSGEMTVQKDCEMIKYQMAKNDERITSAHQVLTRPLAVA